MGHAERTRAEPPSEALRRRVYVMALLLTLLVLMGINLALGSGKLRVEQVISRSMEPTLRVGDRVLVDANAFQDRYKVICFENPEKEGENLVKRVMGLPGDRIRIRNGVLYVNGRDEYSPHVRSNRISRRQHLNLRVPEGYVFVLGDNRNNSYDSLDFGPVPYEKIHGVVWAIIWPAGRIGSLPPYHAEEGPAAPEG